MTFTAVSGGQFGVANASTVSFTSHAVGNFVLLEVLNGITGSTPSSVSSSNATWTPLTAAVTSTVYNTAFSARVFIGTVTAISTATVTVSFSGSNTAVEISGQEFSSTRGAAAVTLDTSGHIDTSGSNSTWASLTPVNASELYWGFATNSGSASQGTTTGYTYVPNSDGLNDGAAYNPNCTAGTATAPVWADTGQQFGIMVLVQETSWNVLQSAGNNAHAPAGNTLSVTLSTNLTSGSKLLAWLSWDNGNTLVFTSLQDTAGNNFTLVSGTLQNGNSGFGASGLWYLDTPAGDVGSTTVITATFNTTIDCALVVQEVSGLLTGSAGTDGSAGDLTGSTTGSAQGPPTYASTASGEYLTYTLLDNGGTTGFAGPSGYNADANNQLSANSSVNVYYKSSTGTTETGTFTPGSGSLGWNMVMVAFKLAATSSPTIITTLLPNAVENKAYSAQVQATGGTTPYTWSILSGSLPAWASLDSSTGIISGTAPSSAGSTTFTIEVTDNASSTATQSLTLNVVAPVSTPSVAVTPAWVPVRRQVAASKVQSGHTITQSSTPVVTWGTGANTGSSTGTSLSLTLGSGSGSPFAAGDIIVVAVASESASTISFSSGTWTLVPTTSSNTFRYAYCNASYPSSTSLTLTMGTSTYHSAITFTVTGSSGFDPSTTSWSTSTLTAASITLGSSGDSVIWLGVEVCTASYVTPTLGVPSGFTAQDHQTAGKTSGSGSSRLGSAVWGAELDGAASGATGTKAGTDSQTGTHTNDAVLIAFKPMSSTTGPYLPALVTSSSRYRAIWVVPPSRSLYYLAVSSGTTTPVSLAAYLLAIQPQEKISAGKVVPGQVVMTATTKRSFTRLLAAFTVIFSAAGRRTGKILAAPVTVAGSALRQAGRKLSAQAAASGSVSMQKVKLLALAAQVIVNSAVARQVSRPVAGVVTATGNLQRSLGRALSAIIAITAAISATRVRLLSLAASMVMTAAQKAGISRLLTGTTAITASTARSIGKKIGGMVTVAGTLARTITRSLSAQAVIPVSLLRSAGRNLAAVVTTSIIFTAARGSVQHAISLAAQVVTYAIQSVSIGRNVSSPVTVTDSQSRALTRALNAFAVTFGTIFTIKAKLLSLTTQVATFASQKVSIGKSLGATVAAAARIMNSVGRKLTAGIAAAGALVRSAGRSLLAVAMITGTASTIKVRLVSLVAQVAVINTVIRRINAQNVANVIVNAGITRSIARPIQGTFVAAGQTARAIGKNLKTAMIATTSTFVQRIRAVTLNAAIAVSSAVKRGIAFHPIATAAISAGFSKIISFAIKAVAVIPPGLIQGRAFLLSLVTGITTASSIATQAIRLSFLTIFKAGDAAVNWVAGQIKKNWRVP